ncbi:unnamed protein product [Linum trigynum]|uniref:Uncharacterized protein n=1 Tax=Linum trigynum TaxID=586398 RepID=A0AAV2D3Q8_9ROSI
MIMVATCDNDRNLNSGSTTSSWRQDYRYGSAAICEPSSSSSSNTTALTKNTTIVPGQCLQVTNLENGRRSSNCENYVG